MHGAVQILVLLQLVFLYFPLLAFLGDIKSSLGLPGDVLVVTLTDRCRFLWVVQEHFPPVFFSSPGACSSSSSKRSPAALKHFAAPLTFSSETRTSVETQWNGK